MADPLRVGILSDTASIDDTRPGSGLERRLRLAIDPMVASGRIDREVEYVHAYGRGLPDGTAAAVQGAFIELSEQGVLIIIGPAIGDNALVATPLADRFELPTIHWAGTERARSEWMFQLQVGSHEDEPVVIARHLARLGRTRIGVSYDRSPIGRRYLAFLQAECEPLGIEIAAAVGISPLATDARLEVGQLAQAKVDAVIYFGLGVSARAVGAAVLESGLDVAKVMGTAGLWGYAPELGAQLDGWSYVDLVSDDNDVLAKLATRDPATPRFLLASGYDLGRLVGEGIARATELTRSGLRDGLEAIKWLPAAEGLAGTVLSFGNHDRGALHGQYLVMRQWQAGQSVQLA